MISATLPCLLHIVRGKYLFLRSTAVYYIWKLYIAIAEFEKMLKLDLSGVGASSTYFW